MKMISFRTATVLFLFVGMLGLLGCEKNTTAKKINNKLTEGKWRIARSVYDGENITSDYNGYLFQFSKEGTIAVSGTVNTKGTWYTTEDKNPAKIFLNFHLSSTTLYFYSDDWYVTQLNNNECYLENIDHPSNKLVFRKVGK